MRKHRRKERIHQERVDNKAKEHRTESNRNKVSHESTLAKGLAHHQHASDTRCRARHQQHQSRTRRNAFFNKSQSQRNGTRRTSVHGHSKHQHHQHAKQRVFVQEQEEIIRDKGGNQGAQQKANNQPLAHIADHVHKAIFKGFFHLLRKRLFFLFIVVAFTMVVTVAGAMFAFTMFAFAAAMFTLMMMFVVMFMMMLVASTMLSDLIIRFTFRRQIRKHTANHRRHKSGYRAQNRKGSTEQRICRQNRIHTCRRRRNQEAHACALARPFFTKCNRCRNHAAAANRERYAKQR